MRAFSKIRATLGLLAIKNELFLWISFSFGSHGLYMVTKGGDERSLRMFRSDVHDKWGVRFCNKRTDKE